MHHVNATTTERSIFRPVRAMQGQHGTFEFTSKASQQD